MTTAKTLNQIIAELEAWASSHLQVHSFGQGDIWEVSPSSSEFTFPLMWVTPSTAEPRQNELVEQFNVIVCDLVDNGEANELEVLSDTRQILKDLVAWYRQQHSAAYIVEFQGAITPFTERFAERVSGNALTIRLRQPDDYDECAIPLGTPIPAPPFCGPAGWELYDTDGNLLSTGSIPSGSTEPITAPDGTVMRDGIPYGSVLSGGSINVPSNCPAPPYPAEWQPNPNWPDFPTTLAPTDELFYGIFPVYENGFNRLAVSRDSGNDFTVDPGDGSTPFNTVAGNNIYDYDYATVPATAVAETVDGALTGRMVKYVIVTFTPITSITSINLRLLDAFEQPWVDIYASLPNLNSLDMGTRLTTYSRWSNLERIRLISSSASLNFGSGLQSCVALRVVEIPWNSVTLGSAGWMNRLGPVDEMPDIAIASGTVLQNSAFENSQVRIYNDVDVSNYTSAPGASLFRNARFRSIGTVTFPASKTQIIQDFLGTANCRSPIRVSGGSITNGSNAFRYSSTPQVIIDDASLITNTSNMFGNANVCDGVILNGITVGFSVAGTNLTTTGASASFTALGIAAGAQNITVTGTPFGVALAALDAAAVAAAAIATGKGFTIVN